MTKMSRAYVVYVDMEPACGPGRLGEYYGLLCNEKIIVRQRGKHYVVDVTYMKGRALLGVPTEIKGDVEEIAFEKGLMKIDPQPLDKYLGDELKAIFG